MLEKHIRDGRTFVLRDRLSTYSMTNVKLSPGRDTISGNIKKLSGSIATPGNRKKTYYHYRSRIPEEVVLNNIYLFTGKTIEGADSDIQVKINSLNKMHDLRFDRGKTTRSHVGTGVAIFAGVALVAAFIGSMMTFTLMGPV
jgi:hypothetical protein